MRTVRCLAAAALLFIPAAAYAVKDCQPPAEAVTYKIFLDEVKLFDTATPSGTMALKNHLFTSLKSHLDGLRAEQSLLNPVPCAGRFPDVAYFDQDNVEWMNDRKVVMELWGTIDDAGDHKYDASINIAVIPAQLQFLTTARPQALFHMAQRVNEKATSDQLFALFKQYRPVRAYALVGIGLRSIGEANWDRAFDYLCKGASELTAMKAAENKDLLAYVKGAAASVAGRARTDPQYDGALKVPGVAGVCP